MKANYFFHQFQTFVFSHGDIFPRFLPKSPRGFSKNFDIALKPKLILENVILTTSGCFAIVLCTFYDFQFFPWDTKSAGILSHGEKSRGKQLILNNCIMYHYLSNKLSNCYLNAFIYHLNKVTKLIISPWELLPAGIFPHGDFFLLAKHPMGNCSEDHLLIYIVSQTLFFSPYQEMLALVIVHTNS